MQKALLLAAAGAMAAALPSQCPLPASPSFRTLFQGTTTLGAPSVTDGANMFFDLAVNASITISQIDVNLTDAALIGQTTSLVVWETPGTFVGQHNVPAVWTLVGVGTLTIAAANTASPAVFNTPFTLLTGSHGIALQHLPIGATVPTGPGWTPGTTAGTVIHPYYTNPASVPTPTTFSDAFITLTAGGAQGSPFVSGLAQPRVVNTEIHYTVPTGAAFFQQYGTSCYDRRTSFYEHFPAPGSIDLASGGNTGLQLLNLGPNYLVTSTAAAMLTPVSPSLTLGPFTASSTASWDDASITVALPASWTTGFPYPGGSTVSIDIGSNGEVSLQPSTTTLAYYSGTSRLLGAAPRLCAAYGDWDPSVGGTLTYDVGPADAFVYITWMNVPEWNQLGTSNSFQLVLHQSGQVEYIYGTVNMVAAEALVGWSPGGGAADPHSIDLSASVPFQTGVADTTSAVLGLSARPVAGSAPNLVATNLHPATLVSAMVASLGSLPGINLPVFGVDAPGCKVWVSVPTGTLGISIGSGTHTQAFPIPGGAAFLGTQAFGQSAQLVPPGTFLVNNAGVLTTNGVCMLVGSL